MPALKLTPARRAELRAQAHALNPVVMIGADGLTPAVLKEITRSVSAHELIKIRVAGDDREARAAMFEHICDTLGAAPVQHIGKLLVIYRPAPAEPVGAVPTRTPKGRTPKVVTVVKHSTNPGRRPTVNKVVVRGNERLTSGGLLKKAKKRQVSVKRRQSGE